MNDATKLRIRRELAERMGYFVATGNGAFWLCFPSGESVGGGWATEEDTWSDAPDPLTDHADCAALVEWLFNQRSVNPLAVDSFESFLQELLVAPKFVTHFHALDYLTSPLETRVLAACAALGIGTEDE